MFIYLIPHVVLWLKLDRSTGFVPQLFSVDLTNLIRSYYSQSNVELSSTVLLFQWTCPSQVISDLFQYKQF